MGASLNFLTLPAIKVNQPFGVFYIVKIKAKDLLAISFSEPLSYKDEYGNVRGSQRPQDEKRLKEIAKYISSAEMAFPNSIILAANYNKLGNITQNEEERWKPMDFDGGNRSEIIIPKKIELAAIIDGQHRLKAFQYVEDKNLLDEIELVCSIYFDLSNSYQAFLFATINSNQKKVDRSLALEQFGFNVNDEPEQVWTPEKFAVFLSRKLNIDTNSPLHKKIKIAPLGVDNIFPIDSYKMNWIVSTSTVVDGILSLISSNPKRDRIEMQQRSLFSGKNRSMLKSIYDNSPLRPLFIDLRDNTIYQFIFQYFSVVSEKIWNRYEDNSYIFKTVGIQALFDVLKLILKQNSYTLKEQNINFGRYIDKIVGIDFSHSFFQASGIGRSRLKNTIAIAMGLIAPAKIRRGDLPIYLSIINNKNVDFSILSPWEEEAEMAVFNALNEAVWNFGNRNVVFMNDNYDSTFQVFDSYMSLFNELVEIANRSFVAAAPSRDSEFSDKSFENFDAEGIVNMYLNAYQDNLDKLGWS